MSSLRTIEFVKGFHEDAMQYLERQQLPTNDLAKQIDEFAHHPELLRRIDSEIYGLRWAPLASSKEKKENLVALDHEDATAPLLMPIGILACDESEIPDRAASPDYKRRINMAVGRIISLHRFAIDI